MTISPVHVIGAGLAGCEAVTQLTRHGIPVILHEMRPVKSDGAHKTAYFAELVCSNSLRRSHRFEAPSSIYDLMRGVDDIVQIGNITGEGWFLTAEMVELIHEGAPSIACVQPFACLPNHVTGKGMIKELRRRFPDANISAIDYDPGSSEVNQLNRLKLLLSNAPVGRHPDEVDENMIRMPDGTLVEAEIRLAAGATDTDPAGETMKS